MNNIHFLLMLFIKRSCSGYYEQKSVLSTFVAVRHNTLIVECVFYCKTLDSFASVKEERKTIDDCYCVKEKEETIDDLNSFKDEVVLKPIRQINLSEGKPSWHSSYVYNYASSRAFDGNLYQYFSRETKGCQHSDNMLSNEWIKVDLIRPSVITRVKIYNELTHSDRLRNAKIEVASSLDMMQNYQLCAAFEKITTPVQIETFECNKPSLGRYVRLRLSHQGYLTVCEMQVMGYHL